MFRQWLGQTDDVLTHRCILLICPVCTDLDRTIHGGVVADAEVPMFALLRGTVGLPLDNPTWWPEGIPRTGFAQPTVDLLERTLRALRAPARHADRGLTHRGDPLAGRVSRR